MAPQKLGTSPSLCDWIISNRIKFNLSNSFVATAESLVRLGLLKDSPKKAPEKTQNPLRSRD